MGLLFIFQRRYTMGRTIGSILSLFVSVVVIIWLMRFLGVTWGDFDSFITHGLGGGLKILQLFKGIFSSSPAF